MNRVNALSWALGALCATSAVATAQSAESTTVRPRGGRGGAAERGRGGQLSGGGRGEQALARQVRQAFSGVVRRELNLTDDQVHRLDQVDQKFQLQRNEVGRDERAARISLKTALEDTATTPDAAKIEDYMSRLVKAQHRRADILEGEQKELAAFLTPVQRAKYLALREQLMRRVAQMRQDGPGGRRGGPPLQP